jgi:hypothetical protein
MNGILFIAQFIAAKFRQLVFRLSAMQAFQHTGTQNRRCEMEFFRTYNGFFHAVL